MGEAKRKTGAAPLEWRDVKTDVPPRDAHGLVVLVVVTCNCAKGAQVALSAGRKDDQWVIEPFEHSYEIDYWMRLPAFPPPRGLVH